MMTEGLAFGMKKRVLVSALIFFVVAIALSFFFLWGNNVYARRVSALRVDLEDERYLNSLYLGEIDNIHYVVMQTVSTVHEITESLLTTHLIGIDNQSNLVFRETIKGGFGFGTQILADNIYVPFMKESGDDANSYAINVYDLMGNFVSSVQTSKMANMFFMLEDEVFAVYNDDFLSGNRSYLNSHILSLDNQVTIDLGIKGQIRNVYSMQDGTVIIIAASGFVGDYGDGFVSAEGTNIYRINKDYIIWEASIPDFWFSTGGLSPSAIVGNSIIFSTISMGVFDGPAFRVDFYGNIAELDGYTWGLQSPRNNFRFQRQAFFSVDGFIDIPLIHYRYRHQTNATTRALRHESYILRLDQNGDFVSRKRSAFLNRRELIWISQGDNGNRRFFTVSRNEGFVEFGIFVEAFTT